MIKDTTPNAPGRKDYPAPGRAGLCEHRQLATGVMPSRSTRLPFRRSRLFVLAALSLALPLFMAAPAWAADVLTWRTNQNRVSADIKAQDRSRLLEQIVTVTGWKVFIEPDTSRTVSAKFNNLPPGEALRLLLGDL